VATIHHILGITYYVIALTLLAVKAFQEARKLKK